MGGHQRADGQISPHGYCFFAEEGGPGLLVVFRDIAHAFLERFPLLALGLFRAEGFEGRTELRLSDLANVSSGWWGGTIVEHYEYGEWKVLEYVLRNGSFPLGLEGWVGYELLGGGILFVEILHDILRIGDDPLRSRIVDHGEGVPRSPTQKNGCEKWAKLSKAKLNVPVGFGGRGLPTQLRDRGLNLMVLEPSSVEVEFLDVQSVSDSPV